MSKGSTWNIWDFHLHTPFSVLNNQFGDPESDQTWENYVLKIEQMASEKGVAAIGITDYFMVDGYERVLSHQSAKRLEGILLIPNIEFRVDKVIYRDKGDGNPRRLNLHVLFAPSVPIKRIRKQFLEDLDFVYESEPFEPSKTRKLKRSNLIEFGEHLQQQHSGFRSETALQVGCKNAVVRADKLKEGLDNAFKGQYMLVLADENLGLLPWDGQDHAVRKQLVQMSHAIFSSNPNARDFGVGKKHSDVQAFLDEFRSLKPCIWGCDSHGFDERFLEPDCQRYCWIKGEVSWEGLKQILFEPEERVRIQENCPESAKSIYTIDTFQVDTTAANQTLCINAFQLDANPNLITIIGGRGSGKTAILDLLAACFREGEKLALQETSFFHRLYVGDDPKRRPSSQPIPVRIGFASGNSFVKQVGREADTFGEANIIYLTQNHFDEYSANPDKLNEHIIDLVFEKYADDRRRYQTLENDLVGLERRIQSINLEIEQLHKDIEGQKQQEETSLREKVGEQADCAQRITSIEDEQGGSDQAIVKLTQKLDGLIAERRTIESLLVHLNDLQQEVRSFEAQYGRNTACINEEIGTMSLVGLMVLPTEIKELSVVKGAIEQDRTLLENAEEAARGGIENTRLSISNLEGVSKVIAELRGRSSEIAAEIKDIQGRIAEIIAKEKRIAVLEKERLDLHAMNMAKMIGLKTFLQNMITRFEQGKDEMLDKLAFTAFVDMRGSRAYLEALAEKVDNRVHPETALSQKLTPIFDRMDERLNTGTPETNCLDIASEIIGVTGDLKRKRLVTESDFYNLVFSRFFRIGLRISFNDKSLTELSMGERAIVLLKILLALDDKPLLIDQPEEHLDNRYIYKELVPAFRSAKKKRQIIVATHNANLVVNTDAEQVIVAECQNGQLSYQVGTLEDLTIRESIKTILEGGDEAFKKREEKYGYKF